MAHAANKQQRVASQKQRAARKARIQTFSNWQRTQAALDYKQSIARAVELEHSDDMAWQLAMVEKHEADRASWM